MPARGVPATRREGPSMEYRNLGATGLKVSPLCLGTMMLGAWGNPDHEEGVRLVHRALDAGINFVDTANMYSDGESETIVGKALQGRREQVVLATKVWAPMGPGPNQRGLSRKAIQEQAEASLRRPRAVGEALQRLGDRRRPLGERRPRLGALRLPPAALQHPPPHDGGRALPDDRALRPRQPRLEPARRGLALGQVPRREPRGHRARQAVGRRPREPQVRAPEAGRRGAGA